MSIHRITLTAGDDREAPPNQEIDIEVVRGVHVGEADTVYITVYDGSADDHLNGRTRAYAVPELRLRDLVGALSAFSPGPNTHTFSIPEER